MKAEIHVGNISELRQACDKLAIDESFVIFEIRKEMPYIHVNLYDVIQNHYRDNINHLLQLVFPGWRGALPAFAGTNFRDCRIDSLGILKKNFGGDYEELDFKIYPAENFFPQIKTFVHQYQLKYIPQGLDAFMKQLIPMAFPKARIIVENKIRTECNIENVIELRKACKDCAIDERNITFEICDHEPYLDIYIDGALALDGFAAENMKYLLETIFPRWTERTAGPRPVERRVDNISDLKNHFRGDGHDGVDFEFRHCGTDFPMMLTRVFHYVQENIPQRLDYFLKQLIPLAFPKADIIVKGEKWT